jgi:hypothetical protein
MIKAQADSMAKRGKELKAREIELLNKTQMDKKKRPVVMEFVDSESRYNKNLRDLIKHYLTPRKSCILARMCACNAHISMCLPLFVE